MTTSIVDMERVREARKSAFLEAFVHNGGNLAAACRQVGIAYSTQKLWREIDPDFVEALEEAKEIAADDIVAELHQRAVHGREELLLYKGAPIPKTGVDNEPITDKEGKVVYHTKQVRSDRLLEVLVKAVRPEFRDKGHGEADIKARIALDATVQVDFVKPDGTLTQDPSELVEDAEIVEEPALEFDPLEH